MQPRSPRPRFYHFFDLFLPLSRGPPGPSTTCTMRWSTPRATLAALPSLARLPAASLLLPGHEPRHSHSAGVEPGYGVEGVGVVCLPRNGQSRTRRSSREAFVPGARRQGRRALVLGWMLGGR